MRDDFMQDADISPVANYRIVTPPAGQGGSPVRQHRGRQAQRSGRWRQPSPKRQAKRAEPATARWRQGLKPAVVRRPHAAPCTARKPVLTRGGARYSPDHGPDLPGTHQYHTGMNSKRGTATSQEDAGMKPEPDGFHDLTDRERLAIVTAKLEDALDFLKAMPPVPVTQAKCRELEEFMHQPWAKRLRSQADRYEEGMCLGPTVDWAIKATLVDHVLELKMKPLEPGPMRRQFYQEILSGLVAGLRFTLTPMKEARTRESLRVGRRQQG